MTEAMVLSEVTQMVVEPSRTQDHDLSPSSLG